jgi:sugar/nucleoside kinase (ribokinase family)
VQLAWEQRTPVIWQLKPDIAAYPPNVMREFTVRSQVILMNYLESRLLCDAIGLRAPPDLLSTTTKIVVVTSGEKGAEVITADGRAEIVAVEPPKTVDTTGAGDAFTGGFLAGLLQGRDAETCGRIGSVVASFALEKLGCQTNLPDWSQLEARYSANFGPL